MRQLKIICKDFTQFIVSKTNITILILLGLCVSSFCVTYYYALMKDAIRLLNMAKHEYRDLTFVYPDGVPSNLVYDAITDKEGNLLYAFTNLEFLDPNAYTIQTSEVNAPPEGDPATEQIYGFRAIMSAGERHFMLSGRDLDEQDGMENTVVVNVDVELTDQQKESKLIEFYGTPFKIVGTANMGKGGYCAVADYRRLENLSIPIQRAVLTLPNPPSKAEMERLTGIMKQLDPHVQITGPGERINYFDGFWHYFAIPVIVISLGFLSMSVLIGYSFFSNQRKYAIYKLCGISKKGLFILLFTHTAIFTVIAFGLSTAIYTLIQWGTNGAIYPIAWPDALVLLAAVLVVSTVLCLPQLMKALKSFDVVKIGG